MTHATKLGAMVLSMLAVSGCGGSDSGASDPTGGASGASAGGAAGAAGKAGSGGTSTGKGGASGATGKGGASGGTGKGGSSGGGASAGKGGAAGAPATGGMGGKGAGAMGGNGAGAMGGMGAGAWGGMGAGAMGGQGAGAMGGMGAGAMGGKGAGAMGGSGAGAMAGAGAMGGMGAGAMAGTGAGAVGGGAGATGGTGAGGSSGCTPVNGGGIFTAVNPWNTDVSCDPPSVDSKKIIDALVALGGWGSTNSKGVATNVKFKMDMSIEVMQADGTNAPFQQAPMYYLPDCDQVTTVPLPKVGAIEGEFGPYMCDTANNDCHLLVVDAPKHQLWELYNTNVSGGTVSALCVIKWDLSKSYPSNLRGDGCTSADAGGFPIAAMLPNADEVKAGAVNHAFRFILGNDRIRKNKFVNPGTHTTSATGGGTDTPPYGVRFRLRADYPLASLPSDGARVLAKALQRFGMFLADGGTIPLTVQSDQFTKAKWGEVGIDADALTAITPNDFEVVDKGPVIDGGSVACMPM